MIIVPIIALYRPQFNDILVSIRPENKAFGGYYEFPGGKAEQGETGAIALCREISEELGLTLSPDILTPLTFIETTAAGKNYLLLLYFCDDFSYDKTHGQEGQITQYVDINDLKTLTMPPANTALVPIILDYIKNRYN